MHIAYYLPISDCAHTVFLLDNSIRGPWSCNSQGWDQQYDNVARSFGVGCKTCRRRQLPGAWWRTWRAWSLCSNHGEFEGSGVPALFKSNVFSGDLGWCCLLHCWCLSFQMFLCLGSWNVYSVGTWFWDVLSGWSQIQEDCPHYIIGSDNMIQHDNLQLKTRIMSPSPERFRTWQLTLWCLIKLFFTLDGLSRCFTENWQDPTC